jgi:hypothetical protein
MSDHLEISALIQPRTILPKFVLVCSIVVLFGPYAIFVLAVLFRCSTNELFKWWFSISAILHFSGSVGLGRGITFQRMFTYMYRDFYLK